MTGFPNKCVKLLLKASLVFFSSHINSLLASYHLLVIFIRGLKLSLAAAEQQLAEVYLLAQISSQSDLELLARQIMGSDISIQISYMH